MACGPSRALCSQFLIYLPLARQGKDEGNKLPQQKKEGENDITYLYTERNYLVPEISVQLQ